MKWIKKAGRIVLKGLKWMGLIILAALVISGIYNLTLPNSSTQTEVLTQDQKIYIAEYLNLQDEIISEIWPGFDIQVPAIVYNEEYAFLVGLEQTEPGWVKMPQGEVRGSRWEPVTDDYFLGETYHRQELPDPDITPENFTVKVGEQWVSTMQTREFAEVSFYNGFKQELPPFINLVFPYKLFWNLIMGDAENYITGLIHEGFHAYQAVEAYEKFAASESAAQLSGEYPWGNSENRRGWQAESDYLMKAWETDSEEERAELAGKFIEAREQRRANAGLTEKFVEYEKQREWLEGLAKYTELKIGVVAAYSNTYEPVDGADDAAGFNMYQNKESYLKNQISEAGRASGRDGESRFYYGGMLQAMVLDKLDSSWREEAMEEGLFLEDFLNIAVSKKEAMTFQ